MTMPASLQRLLSNQSTDFQNLGFALYDLIAAVPVGDVVGPGVAVNLRIAVFSGTTGKLIADGGQTIAQVIAAATAGTVVGPAGAVADNLPSFNGVTGLIIKDSGVSALSVVVGPVAATTDNIAVFDGVTGKLIKDGAQTIAQVIAAAVAASGDVVGPAGAVNLSLCEYDGITGLLIKDSGILASTVVIGPAVAVNGNVAVFSGTTGKLIADGGAPPAGSPGLTLIAENLLGGDAADVTFAAIPGTYRHLLVVIYARSTVVAVSDYLYMQFNGDTGNNYDRMNTLWIGAATSIQGEFSQPQGRIGEAPGTLSVRATQMGCIQVTIPLYAGTTFDKNAICAGGAQSGNVGNTVSTGHNAFGWRNTAALTSIRIFPTSNNFKAGSMFSLYGMK